MWGVVLREDLGHSAKIELVTQLQQLCSAMNVFRSSFRPSTQRAATTVHLQEAAGLYWQGGQWACIEWAGLFGSPFDHGLCQPWVCPASHNVGVWMPVAVCLQLHTLHTLQLVKRGSVPRPCHV